MESFKWWLITLFWSGVLFGCVTAVFAVLANLTYLLDVLVVWLSQLPKPITYGIGWLGFFLMIVGMVGVIRWELMDDDLQ